MAFCLPLLTLRGYSIDERVRAFSHGAGSSDLLLMVWIFVLAGAFAASAKDMGAVTATVDLTMRCLPGNILLAGLFLASCVVSLCIGTSVGTIVALVPMAAEMSARTGVSLPFMVAIVVGGSFFGDNLSFISDTTVAATRTQNCTMRDKFRTNFRIVLPAAILCFGIYAFMGFEQGVVSANAQGILHLWRVLPYAVVLVAALCGMNVMMVLCVGTLLTGVVGIAEGAYTLSGWLLSMAHGITGMGDLILISMMAGGLLAVVRKGGGVTYLVRVLTRRVHSRRAAECCIASLVALTNCCTANNTVAILSVGAITKDERRCHLFRKMAAYGAYIPSVLVGCSYGLPGELVSHNRADILHQISAPSFIFACLSTVYSCGRGCGLLPDYCMVSKALRP
jgi:Na+/H+ antiporter NhaC